MTLSGEQLKEFVKKNPITVGCGLLSLVLCVAAYWRSDLTAEQEALLETKTAEAQRLSLNRKNADQLTEHYNALIASKKEIDARMIRSVDLATNSQYFYKLESETGVKLVGDIRQMPAPRKDPTKTSYVPTAFSVNVQGDYAQLLNFLRRLENGKHFCRLLTATCNSTTQDRGQMLSLTLNLELLGMP